MAIVVYPYKSEKENELTLTVGEALTLLKFELPGVCVVQQRARALARTDGRYQTGAWWKGTNKDGKRGWFPADYVKARRAAAVAVGSFRVCG
jgi:hypothetical protein